MPDQLYDDNGKPIAAGGVQYDDNGKAITGALRTAPPSASEQYWQAFKDFGSGIGTSLQKTVNAINPFGDAPARPTQAQEAARLDAQLKNAPPLNFDPRVSARAVWKGVTSLTAKDVGEGVGDVGQLYLMGKAAGAVEPETVQGGVNLAGRGMDAVGRGTTALGEATAKGSTGGAIIGAATNHPVAATAAVVVPPLLKAGGRGISALGRAMQSDLPPRVSPLMEQLGLSAQPTGAMMESLPDTPTPGGGRTAMTPNPEVQAASAAADAAARRAELMQQLGVGEKPPLLAEAPEPTAVSGEAREPIPVPVKSEPVPVPPAARPNTLLRSKDLGQILQDVQQQLAAEPVTTASGQPSTVTAAGEAARTSGRPPLTQAEYDALQARIPENAARATDPLPPPAAVEPPPAGETEAPLPTRSVVPPPAVESEPRLPFEGEGESPIPSREQMRADELSRAREGARDSPDRQKGETVEDYRLRTRGRATGEESADPSIIPARRAKGIDDTIESMYERNATDQEFRDYLGKSKNHPKNGEIAAKIESKAHSYNRPSPLAHVIVGAAGGAMLRNALVGQLQGDQKEQD